MPPEHDPACRRARRARRGRQGRRRPGGHPLRPGRRAARPRPRAARGRAGRGQDAARQDAGRVARPRLQAGAVHARPDAVRRHRSGHLRANDGSFRFREGPGVHQPAARRRDQPHAAEDPGRAARGDGGAPGHDRGRGRARCPNRSSSSPRRTRSSTRAPTRCPRPSSTASCSSCSSATRPPSRSRRCSPRHDRGLDPHDIAAAGPARRGDVGRPRGRPAAGGRRSASRTRSWPTSSPSPGRRVSRRRSRSACRRVARPPLLHASKAWAWLAGRDFVTPDEVKAVAKPALRHRVLLRPELELEGATRRRRARRHPRHGPGAAVLECRFPPADWRCVAARGRTGPSVAVPGDVRTADCSIGEPRRCSCVGGRRLRCSRRRRGGSGIERRLPGVLALGPSRGTVEWRLRNPAGRGRSACLARRRAGPVAAGRAPTRRRSRVPPHGGSTSHAPTIRAGPARPLRHRRASSCGSPARSGSWPRQRRPHGAGRAPGLPAVPVPATRPSCASTRRASSRSGCARRRAAAAAPSSTSCASTRSTTSSGASTGRRRRAPASRSCAPTGPSGTRP